MSAMRAWCNRSLHQQQVGSTVRRKGTLFGRRYFAQSSLLIEDGDFVQPKIGRLVLVRHGQSEWNVTDPTRGLTARFVSYHVSLCHIHSVKLTLCYSLKQLLYTDGMGKYRPHSTGKKSSHRCWSSNTNGG